MIIVGLPCLASCSGGGGGSSGNVQENPNAAFLASVTEPTDPAVAADWSGSAEYTNSTGLAQVKAAEGYARRSGGLPGGQGVRIAIIDSGVDVSHLDLGNLSDSSWSAGGEALSAGSHATFVAGIAGASRTQSGNANDMHGIAYQATLVNFQTSRPSSGNDSFSTSDLVEAMRAASGLDSSASDVESDIFNLSLGAFSNSSATFASLRNAMRDAADEDKIMVLAAGNEGLDADSSRKLQPIYPAAYADEPGIAGYAIVVGNLTSTDQAAPSSNFCGDTKDYCLFAPGSNIRSTLPGGNYGVGSGTSFATPYVAGAAAVVKAAFPGTSSRDVVDRLLLTAADLGAAGVDSTFGRGKLDLEAAMAPVGPTGFPVGPTVDGPRIAVARSFLGLGPGLGIDEATRGLLGRAMAVDSMGFPFPVDLADGIRPSKRSDGLADFVSGNGFTLTSAELTEARFSALISDDDVVYPADGLWADSRARDGWERQRENSVPLNFEADIVDEITIFASSQGGSHSPLGLRAGLADREVPLLEGGGFLLPFDRWAGDTAGAGASFRPSDGTEIAMAVGMSIKPDEGVATSLQRLEFLTTGPGEVELRIGLGLAQEENGFIGGTSGGAFGDDMSAHSQFATVAVLGPLAENIDWFGVYSRGRSSIKDADQGVIGDWSDAQSEAFGLGLVMRELVTDDDGFSFMVGQPLRQEHLEATIDLPTARRPNGDVVTAKKQIDFAPEAREINTEISYRLPVGDRQNQEIRAAGFFRFWPDHDPDSDPEAGFGVSYRWRF